MMGFDPTTEGLAALLAAATPGPWAIEENGHGHRGMVEVKGPRVKCVGFMIATDVSAAQAEVTRANAALIARAPELAADVLRLSATVADLTAANTALVTECARLKAREAEAMGLIHLYRKSEDNGELGMWSDIADIWIAGFAP